MNDTFAWNKAIRKMREMKKDCSECDCDLEGGHHSASCVDKTAKERKENKMADRGQFGPKTETLFQVYRVYVASHKEEKVTDTGCSLDTFRNDLEYFVSDEGWTVIEMSYTPTTDPKVEFIAIVYFERII